MSLKAAAMIVNFIKVSTKPLSAYETFVRSTVLPISRKENMPESLFRATVKSLSHKLGIQSNQRHRKKSSPYKNPELQFETSKPIKNKMMSSFYEDPLKQTNIVLKNTERLIPIVKPEVQEALIARMRNVLQSGELINDIIVFLFIREKIGSKFAK